MSSVPAVRAVPIVPFAERLYAPLAPYAYTLIRIATGAIFVPHGVLKLFFGGATSAMGYGFGLLELVGGLAIALGLYARPFAALLILDVLVDEERGEGSSPPTSARDGSGRAAAC